MRRRNKFIVSAAAAVGLTAAGLSFAAAETGQASRGPVVGSVIALNPKGVPGEIFAPPLADVSPALTAQQAVTKAFGVPSDTAIPSSVSVQLGLYTLPIGDASVCQEPNENCSGDTIVNGTAYSAYRELVYGLARSECPDGSLTPDCAQWDFIDANTGAYIGGVGPPLGGPAPSRP